MAKCSWGWQGYRQRYFTLDQSVPIYSGSQPTDSYKWFLGMRVIELDRYLDVLCSSHREPQIKYLHISECRQCVKWTSKLHIQIFLWLCLLRRDEKEDRSASAARNVKHFVSAERLVVWMNIQELQYLTLIRRIRKIIQNLNCIY